MRAIAYRQYGSPDVLRVEEVDTPEPDPTEVRIRVHAAAVSSTDVVFRSGEQLPIRLAHGLTAPGQPILGTEFAGVVESIGAEVTRFAVGDEVYAASGDSFGAHAEYIVLPEAGAIAHKPAGATFAEAAALAEGVLTALPFLRDVAELKPGQRILINGASGSIGVAAVQLAKHLGAHVTAVCSAKNHALVESLGADAVLDYRATDFTEGSDRYDVVFDTVGKSSFSSARRVLTENGRYLSPVLSLSILWASLWTRVAGRQRATISFTGLRSGPEKTADLEWLAELHAQGAIRPVIDAEFSMAEIADAHRLVETGHKRGNAVLQVA